MSTGEARRSRLLARLVGDESLGLKTERLCAMCADVVGMSGAGIMLMPGDVPHGSACTTNDVSALIERLQFDLGEGPCIDAHREDRPVLEPDLADPATPRWPAFSEPALAAGVRAIFGFPLKVGGARLGALNLYCDQAGVLTDDQHADALVMADLAAQALLILQSEAPPGELASALESNGQFQYVVHQAAGMVAVQLQVSVSQALVRLRAHAFGNDRPLADVARDVVERRLRFDAQSGEKDPTP